MTSPIGEFLRPPGFDGPRGLRALSREGSTVLEAAKLVRRARADKRLRQRRPYAGMHNVAAVEPVILVPGFMAGDGTLRAMSMFLRQQGFRTYRSEIRVNVGCTREAVERLERRVEAIALRRGRKVTVVGHSLGGMLARGLAVRRPDLVAGIVTMGSPVLAPGAVHRLLAWDADLLTRLTRAGFGGLMSTDCIAGECARNSFEESQSPIDPAIGYTAVYSRRDGIVDWHACLDPGAQHAEVRTSHCGMAIDPAVFDVVLTALRDQRISRASQQEAQPASAAVRLAARR